MKEYKTVAKFAVAEIDEKKSRFICSVKPVTIEDQAIDFINELKSRYWDATHNVYCYYIAGESIIQRYSDDGEPSGTAGLPVLEAVKRAGVQDVVVVVTRYFGGTLLGASGLVRAYGKSAQAGIEAAGVVRRMPCTLVEIIVEYGLFGKMQNYIMSKQYTISKSTYGQDVEIDVLVPINSTEEFLDDVTELTSGRAVVQTGETTYVTVNECS